MEIEHKNLQKKFDELTKANNDILLRVKQDNLSKQNMVDQTMLKSLFLKYFDGNCTNSIRKSLLETIANFMEFNEKERSFVGLEVKYKGVGHKTSVTEVGNKIEEVGNKLYDHITKS